MLHGELLPNHPEAVAAPEDFAIDGEGRHAKNTQILGLAPDPIELAEPLAARKIEKGCGLDTALREQIPDHLAIFDVELALPEALEGQIVVLAKSAPPLCIDQSNRRDRGVEQLLRP